MTMPIATPKPAFSLMPQSIEEAMKFAEMLSRSDLVPKDYQGKPGNILVAMQWGTELGMQIMQAIQNISVINGRPAMWGDSVIALVRSSPVCEYVIEDVADTVATCRAKRRGEPEQIRTFSLDDAKRAGLLGKQGPWTQYPKRMMQMRARSWALRDVFTDVLRGMAVAEEVMDLPPERDMGQAQVVQPVADKPPYPADKFTENFPKWEGLIASGRKSAADVIATIESKNTLSAEQRAAILEIAPEVTAQ
ncbi:MAG TPA: hypothetical protein VJA19_02060 [Pseudomonas sp.]|nr:hypothetical protein [Pseudomonas sp.]